MCRFRRAVKWELNMLRLSNISIGIKLAVMSGLAILLVGIMIVSQMLDNSAVGGAIAQALKSQNSAVLVVNLRASVRGMQISVRDLRLAATAEEIKKADLYLSDSVANAIKFADALLSNVRLKEQIERGQKIRSLLDSYFTSAKELSALRNETLSLQFGDASSVAVAAADRLKTLNVKFAKTAREQTLPVAEELEALSGKSVV